MFAIMTSVVMAIPVHVWTEFSVGEILRSEIVGLEGLRITVSQGCLSLDNRGNVCLVF